MKTDNENIKDKKQKDKSEEINENINESANMKIEDAENEPAEIHDENNSSDTSVSEEKDPLTAALEEIERLKDKYLRSAAEFDNYRKRTLKEKTELILNGSEKAVQAFLPIMDDMERAVESSEKTDDVGVLREGMKLICQKTIKVMESIGVNKIDTTDADFDTDYHEAVAMVPGMGDEKKGKVLDCIQAGYTLNDKVIRHAKVAVGQ